MARLFVAIELPDESRQRIKQILPGFEGVKAVRPEQIHLTLRFIGEVDEALFGRIRAALEDIRFDPFEFRLAGVGCFPSPKKARVVWVGVDAPDALKLLRVAVEEAVVKAGVAPEKRGFSPHITTGRIKSANPEGVRQYLEKCRNFAGDPVRVEAFHLFSSVLGRKGAKHSIVATYEFR